jgi:hypothetical protein
MVIRRRALTAVVQVGLALIWLGQGHVVLESFGDSRSAQTSACRPSCDQIEPHAALIDALRQLADAESARQNGAATDTSDLAAPHLHRFAGLLAIAIVDRNYGLRWVQTRSSVSLSIADLESIEQACDVLLRHPIEPLPTVVDRRNLRAGGPGFVIAVPVLEHARVASFVVGLLRG